MPYAKAMRDIYSRMDKLGVSAPYLRSTILPDWWQDKLASDPSIRRMAELSISRTLGIPLGSLADLTKELHLPSATDVKFKHWDGVDQANLLPAVAIGRRLASLALEAVKHLPEYPPTGPRADSLRELILSQHEYVTLGALLEEVWRLGVPVVHIENLPPGARRVDGFALRAEGRPVIVLATSRQAPAWIVWHLAHELGHIVSGHLQQGDVIDVRIVNSEEDRLEKEANDFARHIVYGTPDHRGFSASHHLSGEKLAHAAVILGAKERVLPASIVASYGFKMGAWGTAAKGLSTLGQNTGGPVQVNEALRARIDLDRLADTDRHFFISGTGLVG